MMKITVVGAGYVGLSMAVLLSRYHQVTLVDVLPEKIELINRGLSPIRDKEIEYYLRNHQLDLVATASDESYKEADYIIIATPTNYDSDLHYFDTRSIETVLEAIEKQQSPATIIIKSTIPVGYTDRIKSLYAVSEIIFSPEFLREGTALYDNLYPSRVVIGSYSEKAKEFGKMLVDAAEKENVEVLYTGSEEAEAIKLFANTYLALRISFFNELDTYAEMKNLKTEEVVKGIGLDPRIGDFYNNPSFGYGGYCLPKDSKQLLKNYGDIPQELMTAVVASNQTRKQYIVKRILESSPKRIGIYRLAMKSGSDNFRESAIWDIMAGLTQEGVEVVVYEPSLTVDTFEGYDIVHNLSEFKAASDLILCNRWSQELQDVSQKVYTRDLFERD